MKNHFPLVFAFVATALFASAQTLEVTSSGVGIGTTTPGNSLHIRKDQNGQTSAYVENQDTSSGNQVYSSFRLFNGNGSTYGMYLPGQNSTGWQVLTANRLGLYTNNAAGMAFDVDASGPMVMATGGSERMRIDSSGNVMIGTTSSFYKFDVQGATSGGGNSRFLCTNGGIYFDIEGNVPGSNTSTIVRFRNAGSTNAMMYSNAAANDWNVSTGTSGGTLALRVDSSGNLGVGVSNPSYRLHVNGSARATSFISDSTTYADFVFKPDYQLRSLTEVEAAIQRDGHLPDIPSEAEVKAHGIDLAKQQAKLLQKVEELTLYVIDLHKENTALRAKLELLEKETSAR